MKNIARFILLSAFAIGLTAGPISAAEQNTTLMLGGKSCTSHSKEITAALMGVKGVKEVDLKSMKGHAIVTHDETVKPEALVDALMKNAKGNENGKEWSCTGEAM